MLKISLKQGQYVNIGDNIRVVYVGGTGNHGRLMIDAPKEVKIARSTVEQNPERRKDTYYPEPAISKEAQDEIKKILWNERMKAETKKDAEEDVEPVEGTMTAEEKAKAEEKKQKEVLRLTTKGKELVLKNLMNYKVVNKYKLGKNSVQVLS